MDTKQKQHRDAIRSKILLICIFEAWDTGIKPTEFIEGLEETLDGLWDDRTDTLKFARRQTISSEPSQLQSPAEISH